MSVHQFLLNHGKAKSSIAKIALRWRNEKRVDDFLGTEVAAGLLISDVLVGKGTLDDLPDYIPEDVQNAFQLVIDQEADTYAEVRAGLIERLERGDEATRGLMSSLQGRIGELEFVQHAGSLAAMSTSESQEGWDVVSTVSGEPHYVQVKVYESADGALQKIREVEEKVEAGKILGHQGEVIDQIDFAVNAEIYEELKRKVAEEGLNTKVINIGASRDEIRERLTTTFDSLDHPLDSFFSELLDGSLTAVAVHGLVNGFLTYKKAKEWNQAVEDTCYGAAVTTGGLAASLTAEAILLESFGAMAAGPFGAAVVFGVGMSSRAVLRRVGDRRFFARRLQQGNFRLIELNSKLRSA